MTNFIEEQQKEDWQPAKWVLEPTDPLLNWKKGWNEGGNAAVTAFTQHILESGLLEEKTVKELYPEANTEVADHKLACQVFGKERNNTLAKAVKELISNMNKV